MTTTATPTPDRCQFPDCAAEARYRVTWFDATRRRQTVVCAVHLTYLGHQVDVWGRGDGGWKGGGTMTWKCRMIDATTGWPHEAKIGDCWYRAFTGDVIEENFSPDYVANRRPKGILPLWVQLPDGPMCLDLRYNAPQGWTVSGTPPNITVSPSINVIGYYHGWIRNGEISNDIEGRTYPEEVRGC